MDHDDRYYLDESAPDGVDPQVWTDRPAEPWKQTTVVGEPLPRMEGYERVSGTAVFTTDVMLPDMLYGAILVCPHAHAKVNSVDTSAAEKMPGVRAIVTRRDAGGGNPLVRAAGRGCSRRPAGSTARRSPPSPPRRLTRPGTR